MYNLYEDSPGKKTLMMGNIAVARGAIEAGVQVVTGYPGTPATETLEALSKVAGKAGIYVEVSTNEKVAVEIASAAAISNLRALVIMKQVGLNVASDIANVINLSGCNGGLVIYIADDVGPLVSQNEQDTRIYSRLMHLPCLEPSTPQEAKDMIKYAFEISENYKIPVILRSTLRLSHMSSSVTLGKINISRNKPNFVKDINRYLVLDFIARSEHEALHKKINKIKADAEKNPFNILKIKGEKNLGIITSGLCYLYVEETLKHCGLQDQVSVLKLSFSYPLPTGLILKFLQNVKYVLIVEEVEPVLENEIKAISFDNNKKVMVSKVFGRNSGHLPWAGEINLIHIAKALSKISNTELHLTPDIYQKYGEIEKLAPPRYLSFCAGCPHLATFYAMRKALMQQGYKENEWVVAGDIGCYGIAPFSAVKMMDTSFCMGSSIGLACGFKLALKDTPVIAVIGDSTFYHSGISGIVNAMWNTKGIVIVVMDNKTTAMTGHQPNPGVSIRIDGSESKPIDIADVIKGLGIKFIEIVDPYNVKKTKDIIIKALKYVSERSEPAVIITRRECAILSLREKRKSGQRITPFFVDEDKCIGCRICTQFYGCLALGWDKNIKKAFIDPKSCMGCSVCSQICPSKAIIKKEESN